MASVGELKTGDHFATVGQVQGEDGWRYFIWERKRNGSLECIAAKVRPTRKRSTAWRALRKIRPDLDREHSAEEQRRAGE